jgi:TPR repeat protein
VKKAADLNHSEAMLQLGVMYCSGHGAEKDTEQGERWFDMANSGNSDFIEQIASLFHVIKDMQDFILAHKWYKRLGTFDTRYAFYNRSRENDKLAYLGLGLLYEYGDGVKQDYQKTLEYYTKLVDDNLEVGMLRLGLMYYYGKGFAADYRKSLDLFQRSGDGLYAHKTLLPNVYNPNNLCGNDSQGDLVYCLMSNEEVKGERYYYQGL